MVILQVSNLLLRVRFPLPAPQKIPVLSEIFCLRKNKKGDYSPSCCFTNLTISFSNRGEGLDTPVAQRSTVELATSNAFAILFCNSESFFKELATKSLNSIFIFFCEILDALKYGRYCKPMRFALAVCPASYCADSGSASPREPHFIFRILIYIIQNSFLKVVHLCHPLG